LPDYVLCADRSQVAEFFLGFARFEFALKASRFARNGKWGAEVNWDEFSKAIGPSLLPPKNSGIKEAVDYLLASPPKQQVFENGALRWKPRIPDARWSQMRILLLHMQGARNNLVHGAKFIAPENADPNRDRKLLEAASCVIAECLRLCPNVAHAFNGDAP
jgi:hypothetical protein